MARSSGKEQSEALFREYKATGDEEIRNNIVETYLYLADTLAKKYTGRGVDFDDLRQVASFALLKAVERFDSDKGVLFTSFAVPTIMGELKKYFRDTAWALKVPRRMKEISMAIPDAKERLFERTGNVPTTAEIANELGVSEENVLEALEGSLAYKAYSLDKEASEQNEGDAPQLEKYLGDEEKGYGDLELVEVIESVMSDLSDKERAIMRRRLVDDMTQREVADALGLSQMTVSRIEKAMHRKFREEYGK